MFCVDVSRCISHVEVTLFHASDAIFSTNPIPIEQPCFNIPTLDHLGENYNYVNYVAYGCVGINDEGTDLSDHVFYGLYDISKLASVASPNACKYRLTSAYEMNRYLLLNTKKMGSVSRTFSKTECTPETLHLPATYTPIINDLSLHRSWHYLPLDRNQVLFAIQSHPALIHYPHFTETTFNENVFHLVMKYANEAYSNLSARDSIGMDRFFVPRRNCSLKRVFQDMKLFLDYGVENNIPAYSVINMITFSMSHALYMCYPGERVEFKRVISSSDRTELLLMDQKIEVYHVLQNRKYLMEYLSKHSKAAESN